MVEEHYNLLPLRNQTRYLFESKGPQGAVLKLIVFSNIEKNLWNLGFGDLRKGQLDDTTITNNHDVQRVLNTVAQAVYLFTEAYPESIVRIRPIDKRRAHLYNLVFQRRYAEIAEHFEVMGWLGNALSAYSPDHFYDALDIHRKPSN